MVTTSLAAMLLLFGSLTPAVAGRAESQGPIDRVSPAAVVSVRLPAAVVSVRLPAAVVSVRLLAAVGPVPSRFGWPVSPPRVVRRFDPPPRPWLPGHRGVDLAAAPAAVVRSAGAGVVRYAGRVAGRGVVSVTHPGGLRTTYEPVLATVPVGAPVRAGDVLGRLEPGHPGCREPAPSSCAPAA